MDFQPEGSDGGENGFANKAYLLAQAVPDLIASAGRGPETSVLVCSLKV